MGIIRVEKNKNYTVMSNYHLRDKRLSLRTIGLMSVMLSLPDDWDFSINGLATIVRDSRDQVRRSLVELEENGYLKRERNRNSKGFLTNTNYTLYEYPCEIEPKCKYPMLDNPTLDNPTLENPTLENQTQLNTELNKVLNRRSTDFKEILYKSNTYLLSPNFDKLGSDQTLKIIDSYNSICKSLPKVEKITDSRIKLVNRRLKTFSEGEITKAFEMAEASFFMTGKRGKWKASFNWFFENDENMLKVLEGNYANNINMDTLAVTAMIKREERLAKNGEGKKVSNCSSF